MKIQFIIFFILCFATHVLRTIYEILKYKKNITKINLFIYILMTINMFTLWISWLHLGSYDSIYLNIPIFLKYSGLALSIIGILLFFLSLLKIKGRFEFEGKLITTGIYSIIRHPMYTGFIFWIIGYSTFRGALITMFSSIIFVLNILFWILIEEKILIKKYEGYKEYKKRTKI